MVSSASEARELERITAVRARAAALRVIPLVAALWVLVVVLVDVEVILRVSTLTAIVVSVILGARAAVTARRFLLRWGGEDALRPPPRWVTLVAVAGVVATFVAGVNVAADISAGRSTVRASALLTLFALVTLAAVYAHVAGDRGVAAALLAPDPAAEPAPAPPATGGTGPRESPVTEVAPPAAALVGSEASRSGSARPVPQMSELRLLFGRYLAAGAGESGRDVAEVVREFHRCEPPEVVSAAVDQLRAVRARRLDEHALAQVVTLLGGTYDPRDAGGSNRGWLAELEAGLAAAAAADADANADD